MKQFTRTLVLKRHGSAKKWWEVFQDANTIACGGLEKIARGFTKRIENFVCDQCGETVAGNGYTNHCPKCLWSKHVDVNPGDRAAACGGQMRPISVEIRKGKQRIVHQCIRCGFVRRQSVSQSDHFDTLLRVR